MSLNKYKKTLNKGMDKNDTFVQRSISQLLRKEIMNFEGKWMELEKKSSQARYPRHRKANIVCIYLHVDISC